MSNQFSDDFLNLSTVSACLEKRGELSNSEPFNNLKSKLSTSSKEEKNEFGQKLNGLKKNLYLACDTMIQEIQALLEKDITILPCYNQYNHQKPLSSLLDLLE